MEKQPSAHPVRFVAVGDSFTEGVGDKDLRLPNGCRGWADRVAEELARHDSRTLYANLALRGRRLGTIVDDQLDAALAMEPTVVSFYAGGNDLLMARLDMRRLMAAYERAVERIMQSGAKALLFTAYNVPLSPVLEPFKLRTAAYNRQVRRIAATYGAMLVDYWCFEKYRDRRLWAPDRLHMSRPGHEYMATKVLEVLGAPSSLTAPVLGRAASRTGLEAIADDAAWLRRDVGPWLWRKVRGVSSGDHLSARWPALMPAVLPERLGTSTAPRQRVG